MSWIATRAQGEWSIERALAATDQSEMLTSAKLKAEMQAREKKLDTLLEMRLSGEVDAVRGARRKAELEGEITELGLQLREAERIEAAQVSDPRPILEALRESWAELLDAEEKNLALRTVVGRIRVHDGPWGPEKVTVVPVWELPVEEAA